MNTLPQFPGVYGKRSESSLIETQFYNTLDSQERPTLPPRSIFNRSDSAPRNLGKVQPPPSETMQIRPMIAVPRPVPQNV